MEAVWIDEYDTSAWPFKRESFVPGLKCLNLVLIYLLEFHEEANECYVSISSCHFVQSISYYDKKSCQTGMKY